MGLLLIVLQSQAEDGRSVEPLVPVADTARSVIESHDFVSRPHSSTLQPVESATRVLARTGDSEAEPVVAPKGLPRIETFPMTLTDYLLSTAIGVDPGCVDEDTLQVIELVLMDSLRQRSELLARTRSSLGESEFELEWGAIVEELHTTTRAILGG
tara:strand:- start:1436 stop:1903 length:468 start_codon:yes stop_codon:yes gene_type:complete